MTAADQTPERAAGERPLVSILVPAYNAADYLENAIETLLGQTLTSTEIVVVDDGSTDATGEIAARAARRDPRVRVFRQPGNGGVARARERAVAESRGVYLWFVDADDARAEDALDRLVGAARATEADVVVCSAEYVYDGVRSRRIPAPPLPEPVSGRQAFRLLLEGGITGHLWNKLFRRELALGIDFPPARVHSDLAMVAQLLAAAQRVTSIPDVLYSYLVRSGSIVRSGSRRAESLVIVEDVVARAARALDPRILHSPEYRYFQLRYIVLSGLKDALSSGYSPGERKALVAALRSRLPWGAILLAARRRDGKRLSLAISAKTSLRLHRLLLAVAAEHLSTGQDPARE